mmetsp:Transcript_18491/g.57398  ORF Transcript_18491/g.57398 Transcript_18491/m.57398 type:complete len:547 (-) Transcript_18491:345-1985(-)
MVAAQCGSLECLSLLLGKWRAPVCAASRDDGWTALHCAAAGGSAAVVQTVDALAAHGARRDARDAAGRTPGDVIFAMAQPQPEQRAAEVAVALRHMLGGGAAAVQPSQVQPPQPVAQPMLPSSAAQQQQAYAARQQPLPPVFTHAPGAASPSRATTPPAAAEQLMFGIDGPVSQPMAPHAQHASPPLASPPLPPSSPPPPSSAPSAPAPAESDLDREEYKTDHFRIYEFKVRMCPKSRAHDWTECPFAHPGEKARRRDPRCFNYGGTACPDFRKGQCRRGDACEFAHGVFECWLHPSRYRTQLCKDGRACPRRVCFFAHHPSELRAPDSVPMCTPVPPPLPPQQLPPTQAAQVPLAAMPSAAATAAPPPAAPVGDIKQQAPATQNHSSPTSALSLGNSPTDNSPLGHSLGSAKAVMEGSSMAGSAIVGSADAFRARADSLDFGGRAAANFGGYASSMPQSVPDRPRALSMDVMVLGLDRMSLLGAAAPLSVPVPVSVPVDVVQPPPTVVSPAVEALAKSEPSMGRSASYLKMVQDNSNWVSTLCAD